MSSSCVMCALELLSDRAFRPSSLVYAPMLTFTLRQLCRTRCTVPSRHTAPSPHPSTTRPATSPLHRHHRGTRPRPPRSSLRARSPPLGKSPTRPPAPTTRPPTLPLPTSSSNSSSRTRRPSSTKIRTRSDRTMLVSSPSHLARPLLTGSPTMPSNPFGPGRTTRPTARPPPGRSSPRAVNPSVSIVLAATSYSYAALPPLHLDPHFMQTAQHEQTFVPIPPSFSPPVPFSNR